MIESNADKRATRDFNLSIAVIKIEYFSDKFKCLKLRTVKCDFLSEVFDDDNNSLTRLDRLQRAEATLILFSVQLLKIGTHILFFILVVPKSQLDCNRQCQLTE